MKDQTLAYEFDNAQHGADLFNLAVPGNIYTRIMNPKPRTTAWFIPRPWVRPPTSPAPAPCPCAIPELMAAGATPDMIRLCIGIEDIIADLEQALAAT